MRKKRPLSIYFFIIGVVFSLGLSTRTIAGHLPGWYTTYCGGFFWAMMLFFLCAVLFARSPSWTLLVTLAFTWLIEFTQLLAAARLVGCSKAANCFTSPPSRQHSMISRPRESSPGSRNIWSCSRKNSVSISAPRS